MERHLFDLPPPALSTMCTGGTPATFSRRTAPLITLRTDGLNGEKHTLRAHRAQSRPAVSIVVSTPYLHNLEGDPRGSILLSPKLSWQGNELSESSTRPFRKLERISRAVAWSTACSHHCQSRASPCHRLTVVPRPIRWCSSLVLQLTMASRKE